MCLSVCVFVCLSVCEYGRVHVLASTLCKIIVFMYMCEYVCACGRLQLDLSSFEDQIKVITVTRDKLARDCERMGEELTHARKAAAALTEKNDILVALQVCGLCVCVCLRLFVCVCSLSA